MSHSLQALGLAVLSAMAAASAAAAQPATAPAIPQYESAFEGYRPFADEQPIPWKEANDTVHRRGGWRAYAQEAAAAPSSATGGAATAAPADPHPGHHRHGPAPSKEKQP